MDASDLVVVVRGRQAIRRTSEYLDHPAGLPIWATAPLPSGHIALLSAFAAEDWTITADAVRRAGDELMSGELDQTLAVVDALYPGHPAAVEMHALREEVRQVGLDEALRLRRRTQIAGHFSMPGSAQHRGPSQWTSSATTRMPWTPPRPVTCSPNRTSRQLINTSPSST